MCKMRDLLYEGDQTPINGDEMKNLRSAGIIGDGPNALPR